MVKQYRLKYTKQARKDLQACDRAVARRILNKLDDNVTLPDPLQRAKVLTGKLSGKYRYRIGDYRAIFKITDEGQIILLSILSVSHRKDVYR